MSLSHALLTSLLEKPSSGYDLARRFSQSIGFFWHATHQQIYRELARMEQAGWVGSDIASSTGKSRKKLYHVLASGETELRLWVASSTQPGELREPLLIKLRAAAILGPCTATQELERHLAYHREQLQIYKNIAQRDFPQNALSTLDKQLQYLVLKSGLMYETTCIKWCQEAIQTLNQNKPFKTG